LILEKKIDLDLKNIVNLNDNLQAYDNKDYVAMVSNQYCEGLEVRVFSLIEYIEK